MRQRPAGVDDVGNIAFACFIRGREERHCCSADDTAGVIPIEQQRPDGIFAHGADAVGEQAPDLVERLTVVAPGERFAAGGIDVEVVNDKHAVIHPDYPRPDNSGFLLDVGGTSVFHPGDSLDGPGRPVDLLLAPVSAPWMKISEAIDFALAVGAPRNLAIHDKVYSDLALGMADTHLSTFLTPREQDYLRLPDGADLP